MNDPKMIKRRIRTFEVAHNGFRRQRKGKASKFPKLSENGMIAKITSQYF
jgi:hypothetical protein